MKLVAVAEEMATQWSANDCEIEGINVIVEGVRGKISFGGVVEYPVYHPDENQYMPEYGLQYSTLEWKWVNDEWERVYPTIHLSSEPLIDPFAPAELPF